MDVKSKIASFERYNADVAESERAASSVASDGVSPAAKRAKERFAQRESPPSSGSNAGGDGAVADGDDDDDSSETGSVTMKASQSRRSRLQREKNSPMRPVEHDQKKNSVAERRRMRQQKRGSSPAQTNHKQETPLQPYSSSSDRDGKLQQADKPLHSNRRFVHSISHESSTEEPEKNSKNDNIFSSAAADASANKVVELSPDRRLSPAKIAKVQRIQRMRISAEEQHQQQQSSSLGGSAGLPLSPTRTSPPRASLAAGGGGTPSTPGRFDDDNDDEATLTSVRQIVALRANGGSSGLENPADPSLDDAEAYRQKQVNNIDEMLLANGGTAAPEYSTTQSWMMKQDATPTRRDNGGVRLHHASSSDYDSDGDDDDHNHDHHANHPHSAGHNNASRKGNESAMKAFMSQNKSGSRLDDDDRTFDYGSLNDDESQGSFDTQQKEAERKAKESSQREANAGFVSDGLTSPLLNKDDLAYYGKSVDSPLVKTAGGLVVASTIGLVAFGPVGLLLGAAAVGIGVGVMQIPEEQRNNVTKKATEAVQRAQDSALNASDALSSSCCKEGVVADHCFGDTEFNGDGQGAPGDGHSVMENGSLAGGAAAENQTHGEQHSDGKYVNNAMRGLMVEGGGRKTPTRRAACLRDVRIIPVSQIHGLDPAQQPRAWLDVMASANTSMDEKNEAIEEILILAKAKRHARVLLDEGILDSLLWILSRHFEKKDGATTEADKSAKLAANCCKALGKAHCALVHTEGDLLLMSLYEHGSVPEDRQLAQMLYEVPHHVCVTDPSSNGKEVFAIKPISMPQAQELAKSIMQLANE